MPDKVILTVTAGDIKGQKFEFEERATCILGRAEDCYPRIPDREKYRTISRYHCLLDINPPDIRLRDFGSKNGTLVNGQKIGQRQPGQTPEERARIRFPEYDLKAGDTIKLSDLVFSVDIFLDPQSANSSAKTIDVAKPQPIKTVRSPNPNFWDWLEGLLKRANAGEKSLQAIRGYTLLCKLGEGSFGEVYLAKNQAIGKQVALKIMLPKVAANPRAVEMFQREIENTKALDHPNIVKVTDAGFADRNFFLSLEYCNCGSVVDLMRREGRPLAVDQALAIIRQVLDGLAYAHQAEIPAVKLAQGGFGKGRGLVHRDIKPGNIFLASQGSKTLAKIGDYGLAKAFELAGLSGLTMSGSTAKSPAFMPRQQILDFKYAEPAVDVWAAAASLYFMLTGYIPRDLNDRDPFLAVLRNDPVPIRDRDRRISPLLAEVIDRALLDRPRLYFKRATTFKQAIEGL
ncbi:MAG: protein kinase [Oscillatoria sp. SIO1A7]|nr:protein kinase [Oscillatoria sp. SIO1A7]